MEQTLVRMDKETHNRLKDLAGEQTVASFLRQLSKGQSTVGQRLERLEQKLDALRGAFHEISKSQLKVYRGLREEMDIANLQLGYLMKSLADKGIINSQEICQKAIDELPKFRASLGEGPHG